MITITIINNDFNNNYKNITAVHLPLMGEGRCCEHFAFVVNYNHDVVVVVGAAFDNGICCGSCCFCWQLLLF